MASERLRIEYIKREAQIGLSNNAMRRQIDGMIPDLRIMATMACEHAPNGRPCDVADIERGGCCNACWARRFALKTLKKLGKGTGEDRVCQECGVVHLPGQNTLCTR